MAAMDIAASSLGLGIVVGLVSATVLIFFVRRVGRLEQRYYLDVASIGDTLKEQERQTRAIKSEYDVLFENCGGAALLLDSRGRVQRANGAAAEMFGGSRAENLSGKSIVQVTLSTEFKHVLDAARDHSVTQEIVLPGPHAKALTVTISPISSNDADPRYLVVAHDLSELRKLETIRRDFVANVSHELRTPLASIRAMAETLHDGAVNDAEVAPSFLNTIITESDRLARIADDLLVLSEAESRQRELERVDISALANETVKRFGTQAKKAGISISAEIEPELQTMAAQDQMEQVLVNLLDNAVKYTPSGGTIRVGAHRVSDFIRVDVEDTGIGMMQDDLPRIFERFYRVDKARSRASGGTGLGLSIVKNIVEAHGGRVAVESTLGQGSNFTILLPCA